MCWPWFGALERNPEEIQAQYRGRSAPAHGLVRTLDWRSRGATIAGRTPKGVYAAVRALLEVLI